MSRRSKPSPWNIALMDTDRRGLGFTFSDIAADAGVSIPTITRFFNGTYRSPKTAKKIAFALGHPLTRYVLGHEKALAS